MATYLTRTFGTPTNATIWTLSFWCKRASNQSASEKIFSAGTSGTDRTEMYFASDGQFWIYRNIGGSAAELGSTPKYRDANAWYHFVIQNNNGTAAVYVNGESVTLSNTTLGTNKINLASTVHKFGEQAAGGQNFFGCLSHVHFADGTIYAPTVFGSTDSVTGEWSINTSPSFTPGNNGFTILKDGNTITDQSSNSNNFSLAGGTLTKTEDSPSNVFATLNPLSGSLSNNTLSNGNNTIAVTSGWRWRPSTIAPSSGKYYAEFKPTSGGSIYTVAGVTPQVSWKDIDGEVIGSGANSENKSVGYQQDGQVKKGNSTQYTGSSYTTNDIIGVALDLDNHKVYFSKNGTYQNSGDPTSGATGTGAISLDTTLDDWSISISVAGSTTSANYGNGYFGTTAVSSAGTNASGIGIFEYDVPTGFTALSTKGLNL